MSTHSNTHPTSNVVIRNNVKVKGQGTKTLMLAHGFGCDQNMWRYVAPAFESDYRVVLFDYVGSGESDLNAYHPQRYSDLSGYAQDILEIAFALDLADIIFVGHSVSSMIGLLASIQHPEIFDRLVLVCPSPRYLNDGSDYFGGFERSDIEDLLAMIERNDLGWASFLAPMIMGNPDQPDLVQELEKSFCATEPSIARRFAEAAFFADNREDLPKATIPSLVLQCSQDPIAPLEVGTYLHSRLRQSRLHVLEATGHCPHVSHPAETIRVIQDYLSR